MDEDDTLLGSPDGVYNRLPAKRPQFLAGIFACLGPFVFGYCLGFSSPTLDQLEQEGILKTASQQSWFGSLVTVGAILGGPIAGVLVGRLGRKTTIMASCVPFSLGWLMILLGGHFPHDIWLMYFGRILCGIGTGMVSLSVPLYIGEIATKEVRGMLGAGFQLSVTFGILCVYALGLFIPWRYLAVVGSVFSFLLILLMLFIPETPHYWQSRGDTPSALASLTWLRGPNVDVEIECQDIARMLESNQGSFNLRELSDRGLYLPLLLSLALMLFQQMSGVNAIIFYGGKIFEEAGFRGDPNVAALIVASVQVGATFVSCLLMDRLGRRILLLIAGVFMCGSLAVLGLYYLKFQTNLSLDWIPLVSLNIFIISFSLGWGPIPWLVLGEIFPERVKGFASGAAAMTNWALAFLVTKFFDTLQQEITQYGTFWLFSGVCLVGVVFVALAMPETKGKTLEEIQQSFQRQTDPDPSSINNSDEYQDIENAHED